jgi:hypothetical protein
MANGQTARVSAETKTELRSVQTYYETQSAGLGDRFVDAFLATINAIVERPLSFPVVLLDVRRARVDVFPYAIYFRLRGSAVHVIALYDLRRSPDRLRRRLR